ncbi:hypothetical protein ABNavy71_029 [Acinetobacter phage AB-Navy71]|uniref:Uncharacterized protein n=1 Tax=Acinetobacter phage AbTZA1 TaxID=2500827 RepID=A0A3Q9R7B8_9CAUD|nr:hypothetical protein HYP74_gp067 [Acinetobacter phage AbTZA1]AZU98751.1 hypothetical protein [Acinetobacter phage AbTZA1]QQO96734.1 hypothetical protein CPT_Melin_033 [Acinetobacter phage Melin]UQS94106.1 hypothetical protein ABNavy71_029 [Acinetobacter phage AB-Navy71]SSU39420.1 Uncharacterised protein [Acinetobacter baumannii]
MKASITKIPEGTTVVSQLNGEFYFYKPIEGEIVTPEGHQAPCSMVWCTDENGGCWEYSYLDISKIEIK